MSIYGAENLSPKRTLVTPQKPKRCSRAHNITGGFKSLLMTPSVVTAFLSNLPLNTSPPSIHSTTLVPDYMMQRLASQAVKVHGLWCDVCALGISNVLCLNHTVYHDNDVITTYVV